eukprot:gene1928-5017_t
MSSRNFEDAEYDLEDVFLELSQTLQALSNLSGEQRRRTIAEAQRKVDNADDLLYTMESEVRQAPPLERKDLNSRLTSYKQKLKDIKLKLKSTGERSALLGSGGNASSQSAESTREQVLENRRTLNSTSDRLVQIEKLGESSKQTGEQIMQDLDDQRGTIVRIGGKVQGTDANLSKANRILNSMTRR